MSAPVNVAVPELSPAIDFYRDAVGLQVTRIIEDDVAEMTGGSRTLFLLKKPAPATPPKAGVMSRMAPAQPGRQWTPVYVDFVVEDVEEAARRAVRAGAVQETDCIELLGSKAVALKDPFGHGFCLIQLGRKPAPQA